MYYVACLTSKSPERLTTCVKFCLQQRELEKLPPFNSHTPLLLSQQFTNEVLGLVRHHFFCSSLFFRGGDQLGHMLALSLCALPVTGGALCVVTFASTHHKAQKLHPPLPASAPLYCYLCNARLHCGKCPVVLQCRESSPCHPW